MPLLRRALTTRHGACSQNSLDDGDGGTSPASPEQAPHDAALVGNARQPLPGVGHTPAASQAAGWADRLNTKEPTRRHTGMHSPFMVLAGTSHNKRVPGPCRLTRIKTQRARLALHETEGLSRPKQPLYKLCALTSGSCPSAGQNRPIPVTAPSGLRLYWHASSLAYCWGMAPPSFLSQSRPGQARDPNPCQCHRNRPRSCCGRTNPNQKNSRRQDKRKLRRAG